MRRLTGFDCEGSWCAATCDTAPGKTGLLIVSGGNEIRSGAHAGQARLAAEIAAAGFPVFRYDRRGTGDSEGANSSFEGSAADISAAIEAFRAQQPQLERIVAFGNCDAAAALALFHHGLDLDRLVLANPWLIDASDHGEADAPAPAAAIRARYLARLKNPRSVIDLVRGRIDLTKLWRGLRHAAMPARPSGLEERIAERLAHSALPLHILLAAGDRTACVFAAAWSGASFAAVRERADISYERLDSASHSFAGIDEAPWLRDQLLKALRETD